MNNNNNHRMLEHRPTGVTILGALFVIAGVFTLLGGIAILVAIPFVANMNSNTINNHQLQSNGAATPLTPNQQTVLVYGSRLLLAVLGSVLIPLGIASLVVAYGLFKGKGWAWSIAFVLSAIGIAVNAISLVTGTMNTITSAVFGIIINAIILYYLSQRSVKQYFGKVKSAEASGTVGM